jgi:hypothetical protein
MSNVTDQLVLVDASGTLVLTLAQVLRGQSAYDFAVQNGYTGTAAQWFAAELALSQRGQALDDLSARKLTLDDLEARKQEIDDLGSRTTELDALGARTGALDTLGTRGPELDALAQRTGALDGLGARTTALDNLGSRTGELDALAADQPNLDNVAANLVPINSVAANMPSVLSATAAAALAYTYMLGAASVAQQDLSGVTKQLHFSPNAIVGTLIVDTAKDSNPGWVDQVAWTSYCNETLNGAYLQPNLGGAGFPNELTARYVIPNAAEGVNFTVIGTPTIVAGAGGYIQNDGTSGNCVSVPHTAANAPSGAIDITLAAKANLPSWTAPAASMYFFSTGFAGNGGVALQLTNAGKISITWGNGATTIPAISTVALTQGANTDLWVAARLQCNNGGVYTVTFWTSPDGAAWTQLGAAVNGATTTTVGAASNNLFVGSNSAGTAAINGKLYAYQMLLNGLPGVGSVVSKFDGSAITANAAGSYFQLATDGRHYSLNAGSGTTATTTGNTSKPPREWSAVAEGGYVSIYALDQPNRPMWRSFVTTASTSALGAFAAATVVANSLWYREGKLYIGTNQGGLIVDFAKDLLTPMRNSGTGAMLADRRIAARNAQPSAGITGVGVNGADYINVGNNSTTCITGCVYPDAPVDQSTGLMPPTVFVGSATPTLIKDDGSAPITTTAMGTATSAAALTPWYLLVGNSVNGTSYLTVGSLRGLTANWSVSNLAANSNQFAADGASGLVACSRSLLSKFTPGPATSFGPSMSLVRLNTANPLASLFAKITPSGSTGWMVGDIGGCWLSSVTSGAIVAGANVITDSTFDNAGTSALYGNQDGNISHSVSGGLLNVSTNAGAGSSYVTYTAPTEPGVQYTISALFAIVASCTGGYFDVRDGVGAGSGTQLNSSGNFGNGTAGTGTISTTFVAISANTVIRLVMVKTQNAASCSWDNHTCTVTAAADRSYKNVPIPIIGSLTRSAANTATQIMLWAGWSAANYAQQSYNAWLDPGAGGLTESIWGTIPSSVAAAGTAIDRSAASGAYYTFGHDATGKLTGTVFDGTTTRSVTTAASYAGLGLFKASMSLSPSGTLSISVNGNVVASTFGAPLASLSNASAVLTIGQNRALTQPWAGGLALVRIGKTIPTPEQSAFCYQQEWAMFQPAAVCALADTTALQDQSYDSMQAKLKLVSSGYENSLALEGGLVFSAQAAVSQGSFTRCAHSSGIKLTARSTTNPGVDVMIPAYGLREELYNRDRAAAERARLTQPIDFSGGFTATETNGATNLTSVSGWTVPSQANQRGVGVSGTNIPANATLTDYSGSTAYISAAATGAGSQQIALTGFRLPPGQEAVDVAAGPAGSLSVKTEGTSNDYTRAFDGFCETILMTPGATARVHINTRRWAQ